jgi:uncharacterized protein YbjT (DUF2867 family)
MALSKLGIEVVEGNLENVGSILHALRGCDAVFGVTTFEDSQESEFARGRNLVDAIAQSGIANAILSTQPNATSLSGGRACVPHLDAKARIEEYARSRNLPAAFIHIAFYYENFLHRFPARARKNGSYAFGFPQGSTPLASVCAEDIGGIVCQMLTEMYWYKGKVIGIAAEDLRADEYAETLSDVTGKQIVYEYVSCEAFEKLGAPGAREIAAMFDFNRLYVPNRKADVVRSRELYPKLQRFKDWAMAHRAALQETLH